MFSVRTDRDQRTIRTVIGGFISVEEGRAFIDEVMRQVVVAGWESLSYKLLVDATDYLPQSREVADALQQAIAGAPRKALKVALCSEKMLVNMQLRRTLKVNAIKFFSNVSEAEAWLSGERPLP